MGPILKVKNLSKHFDVSPPLITRLVSREEKSILKAVEGIGFEIQQGETVSLVGESGCGKSTVARLVVKLYEPTNGEIFFGDQNFSGIKSRKELKPIRRRIQMIFQDPYASLNPRWRVFDIIAEPLRAHGIISDKQGLKRRITELLEQVSLSSADSEKFPHEFSGGQRQRISIARALASQPDFLVCDEPTSALDVSVQAQILNLMKKLQKELGLTYLFISHDLAVVSHLSDKVGVMYLGRLVEWADTKTLFRAPKHPYTKMLLDAIPDLNLSGKARTPVAGEVPSPINPPSGCHFHPRCPWSNERCRTELPTLMDQQQQSVACHAVEENRI